VHIRALGALSLLIFVAACMGSPDREPGSTVNGAPTPAQSPASLELREVLGPGPAPGSGCWQAPKSSDGTHDAPQPGALCDIKQLRLAPPVIFQGIADAEVRTAGVPWVVDVTLREPDVSLLEQYTTRMAADRGYVAILIDQQLLTVMRVVDRVTDGSLTIEGAFTRDQAMALRERLTGSSQEA
jgi:hypothetical protein